MAPAVRLRAVSGRIRATDEQPAAPAFGGWLRNVECRAGQSITKALKTLARHHPYALIEAGEVERLKKKLF